MNNSQDHKVETSTARGHHYRPPLPLDFASPRFKRSTLAPLPPSVSKGLELPSNYRTTTDTNHDLKHRSLPLIQPFYKKAPGSWKVQYVEDTISTLSVKPWRRPLTMGNQTSEMKDKYKGEPEVTMNTRFSERLQPPKLSDHHSNGPSKSLVSSTQNNDVAGRIYYPKDQGVLTYHGDIYLTTTHKDHRRFNRSEFGEYPKKNYATFWECEDYPKAWGHGSKENPLPRYSQPPRDQPMRDETVFPAATTIPRLPKSMRPVPNRGLTTEVRCNFVDPPMEKKELLFTCPVSRPLHRRDAGNDEIFSIPRMYETEYQFIGQTRPVIVS